MPYLKLKTNLTIAAEKTPILLSGLSQLIAKQTGKPENYVMVECASEQAMLFAGSNAPLAYLECKSIGLTQSQTRALSAALCQYLPQQLTLTPERIYIEFSDCDAAYWGWNGTTFA